MRIISEAELKNSIAKHQLWLWGKEGGKRADLSYADLSNVDLSSTNLSCAILYNANLSGADLHDTYMSYADLTATDLSGANLSGTKLYYTNLHHSDLHDANLRGADLRGANLNNVNLCGVKNLGDVIWDTNTAFYPIQCPESGAFVGYKKASEHIVKLEICEDALRSSATSRKCRCSKAKVLEIQNIDGTPSGLTSVASNYDHDFIYTVGEIVEVKDFDTNRWNECAPGIHFFITREEAVRYS